MLVDRTIGKYCGINDEMESELNMAKTSYQLNVAISWISIRILHAYSSYPILSSTQELSRQYIDTSTKYSENLILQPTSWSTAQKGIQDEFLHVQLVLRPSSYCLLYSHCASCNSCVANR